MKTLLITVILFITGCAQMTGYRPTVDTRYPAVNYAQQQYYRPAEPYQQPYQQPYGEFGERRYPYYDNGNPQYPNAGQPPYYQQSYQQQNYPLDEQECQRLADQSSSMTSSTVTGGLASGIAGAALGAAIGAITGDAGTGATYGATATIPGAVYGAYTADQNYKNVFRSCMRNRGYNVIN